MEGLAHNEAAADEARLHLYLHDVSLLDLVEAQLRRVQGQVFGGNTLPDHHKVGELYATQTHVKA